MIILILSKVSNPQQFIDCRYIWRQYEWSNKIKRQVLRIAVINEPVTSITYEHSITLHIIGFFIRLNNNFIWSQYSYQKEL